MRIPITPVMRPPVRKEMSRGLRFEKSLEGDTTLAATLVLSVATSKATSAIKATTGWLNLPSSTTGSQMAWPNKTTEAEVTATPIKEYSVMAAGKPSAWPSICAFCDLA